MDNEYDYPPAHPLSVYKRNMDTAHRSLALFRAICPNAPRVPGMDTAIRLAWRIEHGATEEEAAGREYVYRWHLTINWTNGLVDTAARGSPLASAYAPHLLGQ
jgi:hypothetical protein